MQFIRLIKPKTEKIYITGVRLEVSEACFNVPTMKIDVVQDVNITPFANQAFPNETKALNAISNLLNINNESIKWFRRGISNTFIARLLTDENSCMATDSLISQWKNGATQLYLTDVYITLERR